MAGRHRTVAQRWRCSTAPAAAPVTAAKGAQAAAEVWAGGGAGGVAAAAWLAVRVAVAGAEGWGGALVVVAVRVVLGEVRGAAARCARQHS